MQLCNGHHPQYGYFIWSALGRHAEDIRHRTFLAPPSCECNHRDTRDADMVAVSRPIGTLAETMTRWIAAEGFIFVLI